MELLASVEADWAKAGPVSNAPLKAAMVSSREILVMHVS
jgi:hypothetical protein